MLTAALFTVAKTEKQPECPSTEEWIEKMRCLYTVEYYSAVKKNEIIAFAATWMDQEIVILSEGSQTDRNVIQHPLIAESKKKRFPKKQKIDSWTWRMNIARGEGIVTEFGINM